MPLFNESDGNVATNTGLHLTCDTTVGGFLLVYVFIGKRTKNLIIISPTFCNANKEKSHNPSLALGLFVAQVEKSVSAALSPAAQQMLISLFLFSTVRLGCFAVFATFSRISLSLLQWLLQVQTSHPAFYCE